MSDLEALVRDKQNCDEIRENTLQQKTSSIFTHKDEKTKTAIDEKMLLKG